MKKQEINYIQQLDIKGLWGLYDVHLKLNPDVNIIVGDNGSGKSTLLIFLRVIAGLNTDYTKQKSFKVDKIQVTWMTGLGSQVFNGRTSFNARTNMQSGLTSAEHHWAYGRPENILVNFIATFDSTSKQEDKPYTETPLDKELDDMLNQYYKYQNRLLKKSENRGKSVSETLKKRDWLFDKLNELFKPTNKRFEETEEDDQPKVVLSNGEKLTLFQLSSGEKQLLIILLTVLCQDEKPSILLLDEPEISLHTNWQHELIGIIRTLNPNCQVIAVTHSPSLFNDGWRNKVIWMADVLTEMKPVLEPVNTEGI